MSQLTLSQQLRYSHAIPVFVKTATELRAKVIDNLGAFKNAVATGHPSACKLVEKIVIQLVSSTWISFRQISWNSMNFQLLIN